MSYLLQITPKAVKNSRPFTTYKTRLKSHLFNLVNKF